MPKDFGTKTLTWTIVSNGETQSIPFTLNKGYPITPFKELGMGNEPPVLQFTQGGPKFTGPPTAVAATLHRHGQAAGRDQRLGRRIPRGSDQGGCGRPAARVDRELSLHKFRGPGTVTFDKRADPVPKQGDHGRRRRRRSTRRANTLLRVQANDESGEGGGGFQCCWTNTYVKVTVQ